MSIWDRISNATRPRPGAGGGPPPGGGGVRRGEHWIVPWFFIAVVALVVYVIGSGLAATWLGDFKRQLLVLLPDVTVVLTLAGFLALLIGFLFLKAPAQHFLARYGKRLMWAAPVAILGGAGLIPVMVLVTSLAQSGAEQLSTSYLGAKPAANICAAAQAAAPAAPPAPRR